MLGSECLGGVGTEGLDLGVRMEKDFRACLGYGFQELGGIPQLGRRVFRYFGLVCKDSNRGWFVTFDMGWQVCWTVSGLRMRRSQCVRVFATTGFQRFNTIGKRFGQMAYG